MSSGVITFFLFFLVLFYAETEVIIEVEILRRAQIKLKIMGGGVTFWMADVA